MDCDGKEQKIDFAGFVSSLAINAYAAMGKCERQDLPYDLDLAREYLDILRMLSQKTAGNLEHDEEKMLHQLIDDLEFLHAQELKTS